MWKKRMEVDRTDRFLIFCFCRLFFFFFLFFCCFGFLAIEQETPPLFALPLGPFCLFGGSGTERALGRVPRRPICVVLQRFLFAYLVPFFLGKKNKTSQAIDAVPSFTGFFVLNITVALSSFFFSFFGFVFSFRLFVFFTISFLVFS